MIARMGRAANRTMSASYAMWRNDIKRSSMSIYWSLPISQAEKAQALSVALPIVVVKWTMHYAKK